MSEKYIVILADGMADEPCEELQGKTPLQYAHTPNMDFLASAGEIGMVRTVPQGYSPGSDVANLSVIGYDPRRYYTGRSPLEAVSIGVELQENDVAFRCNMVTLSEEEDYWEKTMLDYCGGEISTEESGELIKDIDEKLAGNGISFYTGTSYRNLMVWNGGSMNCTLTPPHDISGGKIGPYLPQGEGGSKLKEMMEKSYDLLKDHPVNRERVEKSLNPANSIWLWGEGKTPAFTGFKDKYGVKGGVISAVDLIKGIGMCAGMKVIEVPGATGNVHTDFSGKGQAAVDGLKSGLDFVYVHVEAPDESSHQGDIESKIKAIEEIDEKILGKILEEFQENDKIKIMVLPDHPTPMRTKTHSSDPVPFVIYDPSSREAGSRKFDEETARQASFFIDEGHTLMGYFLGAGQRSINPR